VILRVFRGYKSCAFATPAERSYHLAATVSRNLAMDYLISALIRLIEGMFAAGVAGSAIVVVLTSIEDFEMLFSTDPSSQKS